MGLLLLRIWPALIPLVLYIVWLLRKRRRARAAGEPLPTVFSGPWLLTLVSSVVLVAVCLFYVALSNPHNKGTNYTPKQLKDGKLLEESLR